MSKGSDAAVACFKDGFSCSQAVLTSHSADFGLEAEAALKLSCAFGGGMGHLGGTCGAVTGAFMLIGLKYGKCRPGDGAAKDKTYSLVREYAARFKAKRGSLSCTDLVGFDLSSEEELAKAREAGVFGSICPQLIKESVELVESLL
jgi:C_GCAxxG_C_C family probable redox protein